MMMVTRGALKAEAKTRLNHNFPYFLVLFSPLFLLSLVSWVTQNHFVHHLSTWLRPDRMMWRGSDNFYAHGMYGYNYRHLYGSQMANSPWDHFTSGVSSLLMLATLFMLVGIMFVLIDIIRRNQFPDQPLKQSFRILMNGQYFIGTLLIYILRNLFLILWSLLLFFPAVIKFYSYSQAYFIYRDGIDRGEDVTYLEAITRSRHLMQGHKGDLFVLHLSFMGWFILAGLTCGLLLIWLWPYFRLTLANFYVKLTAEKEDETSTSETPTADPSTSTAD
ncbi:DUF975 family protein [Lactobacillus sp. CC-MHH1034]|nr:DUF975 family protein [Agrilactobacillus fermenti]